MQLLQNGKQQFIDSGGQPLSNGSVGYYIPGTLTPQATYQDKGGTILNPNPIILDSRGQAIVWGTGTYRQIVKDASGVTIWDQIVDAPASGADFANNSGQGGAALIGFDGGSVADFFKSKNLRAVDSITALRALSSALYTRAFVSGYYAVGDGGGGAYWLDTTDTTSADNGGTIIVAADGGRWKLIVYAGQVSVDQFGAKGDGTTDDTNAIMAAFTALGATGTGTLLFGSKVYAHKLLNFDTATGLHLRGTGAIAGTILRNISTVATDGVKLRSSFDCTCSFITFDHASASFTGYLVEANHKPAGSTDTQGLYFFRCSFASQGYNKYTANGVNLDKATLVTFEGCKFGSLSHPVDGQLQAGGSYSNGVRFKNCQSFDNVGYFANYLGQQWTFEDCNFQACHDGAQRIAFSASTAPWQELVFKNCGVYDATAAGTSYLNLGQGNGLVIEGGMWGGRSDLGSSTFLNAAGAISGISVKGSRFSLFTNVYVPSVAGNAAWDLSGGTLFVSCTNILVNAANVAGVCLDLNTPNSSLGTLPGTSGNASLRYNQDGTIEMTGAIVVAPNVSTLISFPLANFPTACWDVQCVLQSPATTTNVLSLAGVPTNTGFNVYINGTGNSTLRWRAIGK